MDEAKALRCYLHPEEDWVFFQTANVGEDCLHPASFPNVAIMGLSLGKDWSIQNTLTV